MSEKFDWKKVLKAPFGRTDDRSNEVLFLPNGDEDAGVAKVQPTYSPPPPVVKQEPVPTKVYEPPTPLVLPPNTKLDWDEDAYTPDELQKVAAHEPEPEPVMPEPPKVEGLAPEILQPIEVNPNWNQAPIGLEQAHQAEELARIEHEPTPHKEAVEPEPEAVNPGSHTDDLLSRFGVQKVAPRKDEVMSETHNELLGDLERLITGLHLKDDKAPEAPAEESMSQEAIHTPIEISAEAPVEAVPVYEPIAEIPRIEAFEPKHEEPHSSDLATLLAGFHTAPLEEAHASTPEAAIPQEPESDLAALLAKLNLEEPTTAMEPQEVSVADLVEGEPIPHAPEGELNFDFLPTEPVEVPATHVIESPEPEEEPEPAISVHEQASDPVLHLFPAAVEEEPEPVILALPDFGNEAAVVALGAIKVGADLIRLGPIMEKMPVWYGIDGVMHHVFDFDKEEGAKIVAWFKHHAETFNDDPSHGDYGWFDLRDHHRVHVTGVETAIGELITARVYSASNKALELDSLGFSERDMRQVESILTKPSGLVIVGAPIGHEATQLMSSIARYMAAGHREVVYIGADDLSGCDLIRSFKLDPERSDSHGLTVSRALGLGTPCVVADGVSDPLSVASLTAAANRGCLVIVRVEAADAWSAHCLWHQALQLGAPVSPTSEIGVIARRQIRMLCDKCKQSAGITDEQAEQIHRYLPDAHAEHLWISHGCDDCYGVGYRGKVSIHEVVAVSQDMKSAWSSDPMGAEARSKFDVQAHSGPAQDALACALCGMTSWDEIRPLLDY